MKLIVGLGNPGKEFINTRHNIGFMILDNFAKSLDIDINKKKFKGLYIKTKINTEEVILLKPQSFMNLSGTVVRKYLDYFKIDIDDLLVISDDLDLPIAKIKLKYKGSCGGHNGLRDIENHLNTTVYKRMKIGITNDKNIETREYVLSKLSEEEKEKFNGILDTTKAILNDYTSIDFESLMSKYN